MYFRCPRSLRGVLGPTEASAGTGVAELILPPKARDAPACGDDDGAEEAASVSVDGEPAPEPALPPPEPPIFYGRFRKRYQEESSMPYYECVTTKRHFTAPNGEASPWLPASGWLRHIDSIDVVSALTTVV